MGNMTEKQELMNELYNYLTGEVREQFQVKEALTKELRALLEERKQKVNDVEDQTRVYKIRRVFSPLDFHEEEEENDKADTSEIDQDIKIKEKDARQAEQKVQMLAEYLHGIEEYLLEESDQKGSEGTEETNQKILSFSSFWDLLESAKKLHPKLRINYKKNDQKTNVMLDFVFLKEFQKITEFFTKEIKVYVINVETDIKLEKVLIQFQIKPKVPADMSVFQEKKKKLMDLLGNEFFIERWKANALVIKANIKS